MGVKGLYLRSNGWHACSVFFLQTVFHSRLAGRLAWLRFFVVLLGMSRQWWYTVLKRAKAVSLHIKLHSLSFTIILPLNAYNHGYILISVTKIKSVIIQVTLVVRALDILVFGVSSVSFQCHEEHQQPIRFPILKRVSCIKTSPGSFGNIMQMLSLVSENSGASLTSKWRLLFVSRFTPFRYTLWFAWTQPRFIKRLRWNFQQNIK